MSIINRFLLSGRPLSLQLSSCTKRLHGTTLTAAVCGAGPFPSPGPHHIFCPPAIREKMPSCVKSRGLLPSELFSPNPSWTDTTCSMRGMCSPQTLTLTYLRTPAFFFYLLVPGNLTCSYGSTSPCKQMSPSVCL